MHVSAIDEYFHREAICKLIWVRQENLNLQVTTSLVSTSTDGKILVWRYEDKLKYPIKGYLLGKKKGTETHVVGGTALDKVNLQEDNTYLVGTEGGGVYKCSINQASNSDVSGLFGDNHSVRWKPEAFSVLENLPKKSLLEVKKVVERYV